MILTGFLQARQNRRNSPNMTNQMAMITNILPIAFGVFSLQFPAGLVLYFLVSNLWRLGQQEIILRKITRPGMAAHAAASGGAIDVKSEAAPETRGPGGLRKLFQLPAATNGDAHRWRRGQRRRTAGPGSRMRPRRSRRDPAGSAKGNPPSGSQARWRAVPSNPPAGRRVAGTTRSGNGDSRPSHSAIGGDGCDPMEWVETTGRTIEAALDAALDELGVDENDVEYEVLQEPKTGLFARFGGGEARVRARVKPISREKPGERQRRNRRGSSSRSRSDSQPRG